MSHVASLHSRPGRKEKYQSQIATPSRKKREAVPASLSAAAGHHQILLAIPVGLRCTPLPHFQEIFWDLQMTASACWRQRGLLLRSPNRILIIVVGLLSMGFDTLRTVTADTNETVLEGSLIRYGESAAQIAFATGESRTCSRDGRRPF